MTKPSDKQLEEDRKSAICEAWKCHSRAAWMVLVSWDSVHEYPVELCTACKDSMARGGEVVMKYHVSGEELQSYHLIEVLRALPGASEVLADEARSADEEHPGTQALAAAIDDAARAQDEREGWNR